MQKEDKEFLRQRFKLMLLEFGTTFGVRKMCRQLSMSRTRFYEWRRRFDKEGEPGLYWR